MVWIRAAATAAKLTIGRNLARRSFHSSFLRRSPPVPRPVPLSRLTDSFLDGTSTVYLEELQRAWESDPRSVDDSWDHFFRNFTGPADAPSPSPSSIQDSMRLLLLIRAYQTHGHRKAKLDPLSLDQPPIPAELDPALYGFTDADLDREFYIGVWRMSGFLSENNPTQTLRSVIARLEHDYCGSIGYEYMHIADRDKCNWLRHRIESHPTEYSADRRAVILERLAWSSLVEQFFHTKWPSSKRFGIEGAEVIIPAMEQVIETAASLGVESVVIGTGHRGRVSVLANIAGVPFPHVFTLFGGGGAPPPEAGYAGTGDVKHHIGASYDKQIGGKMVHLSVVANPSHLEAVNPVVLGKTRAKQYYAGDTDRSRIMPLMLQGDGSFAGQGVVAEALHLSGLPKYGSGGEVHIVNNNQVAFTTDPRDGRASHYCTDVAKALDAPVFHVNGDDVEAVIRACELAAEWRQTFHTDVVVDIFCFRRLGHNEIDEPFFTQPKKYQVIRDHPTVLEIYQNKLLESGQFSKGDFEKLHKKINSILQEEFDNTKDYIPKKPSWLSASWAGLKSPDEISHIRDTGVKPEILRQVGLAISSIPPDFKPHRGVKKIYDQRAQSIETGEGIDWPLAEALAFGTLISEGNHIRMSGQDVERGTFSHRHAVIHDQETGEEYYPLGHVNKNQNKEMFSICNSSLSEFAVLGFELGYSMENPHSLVLWEAQFGDFANGGQVTIDNFLSSGEAKWLRQTGLVLLLPHGYDGQGPEHSSSRLERFLQMSDDDPDTIPEMSKQIQECNWQVVNVTTPANYFHVLRRQVHRDFRKPLIVMSPKNLLRLKDCKSHLSEFDDVVGPTELDKQGTSFKRLIEDQNGHNEIEEGISRLILCSGKVYYELNEERKKNDRKDVAICRVEQICPFPYDLIQRELKRYPRAEIVWCQEEPKNMGAYSYVAPRLYTAMKEIGRGSIDDIKYVGRGTAASPATGFHHTHVQQQAQLIKKAMQQDPINNRSRTSL